MGSHNERGTVHRRCQWRMQGPANDKVSRVTRLFWEPKFSAPASRTAGRTTPVCGGQLTKNLETAYPGVKFAGLESS